MSAGAFVNAVYQANYGDGTNTHPIRVQPETLTLDIDGTVNVSATADNANPISAMVSKGKRGLGLHARMVHLKINGAPPDGYSASAKTSVPIMTSALFGSITKTSVVTYLTKTWTVTGTTSEVVK